MMELVSHRCSIMNYTKKIDTKKMSTIWPNSKIKKSRNSFFLAVAECMGGWLWQSCSLAARNVDIYACFFYHGS